jgi:protein tyrosine phosphatase
MALEENTIYKFSPSKRNGADYERQIVILSKLVIESFDIDDDRKQLSVKNFGQVSNQLSLDILVATISDSQSTAGECSGLPIEPTYKNGKPYDGDEVTIPFSKIAMVEYLEAEKIYVYGFTNTINTQTPDKYLVEKSLSDIWYYIKNCEYPIVI